MLEPLMPVDSVNTFPGGLARIASYWAGLPRWFAASQCLQGGEADSNPTLGTYVRRMTSWKQGVILFARPPLVDVGETRLLAC